MAGQDAWNYPPYFEYDEPDTITYHMQLEENAPIAGHGMSFVTTALSGMEWNPDIGEDWTGWDENDEPDFIPDGVPDGDYDPASYTAKDADPTGWNEWNHLSAFTSPATESPDGIYNSDQTIYEDEDFWVDSVSFDIMDGNAFDETVE